MVASTSSAPAARQVRAADTVAESRRRSARAVRIRGLGPGLQTLADLWAIRTRRREVHLRRFDPQGPLTLEG